MNKVKYFTDGVPVETEAKRQVENVSSLPFVKRVAVMPDVHYGKGATIGSVIASHRAVIPAAVGVDIGCGMIATKTSLRGSDLPDSLKVIRSQIESVVPVGMNRNKEMDNHAKFHWDRLQTRYYHEPKSYLVEDQKNPELQLGSLGGGNHFIELCLDENEDVWIMLHSGSRNVGNLIGRKFIELAKKDMEKWFISLPDNDLSYLVEDSEHFDQYVDAVSQAQDFAWANRKVMLNRVVDVLRSVFPEMELRENAINCHHNYITKENHMGRNLWVTRKGAVRARDGDLGIIPGSMGAKSFIVKGKGNVPSLHSCSHGAGRKMSRNAAKKKYTKEDLIRQTKGIECRKDKDVIDEIPGAYKDIDKVMAAQKDLVEVQHTLKQVMCVKG
jgi:tRNA-splicing ligase RtcB